MVVPSGLKIIQGPVRGKFLRSMNNLFIRDSTAVNGLQNSGDLYFRHLTKNRKVP